MLFGGLNWCRYISQAGGGLGRHVKMQTGHGKADCNGEQGKDCYWGISMLAGRGEGRRGYVGSMDWVGEMRRAGI